MTDADDVAAVNIATERHAPAIERAKKARNGSPPTNSSRAFLNHLLGVRTELIGKRYFDPIEWNDLVANPGKGLPDLWKYRLKIDIKGRSKHWYDMLVQPDDCHDEWAYLLITAEHPEYYIRGWCWGREARLCPIVDFGGLAHCVKQNDSYMKSPIELWRLT